MNKIPWYQSTILQQQIVQLLVAMTTIFGGTTGDIDLNATTGAIFGGISALMAVATMFSRLYKVHRPITDTAVEKHLALSTQRGFARPLALAMLALCACTSLTLLPGCAGSGTKAAFSEAKTLNEQAFVLAEEYASLVEQAANLKAKPTTPTSLIERMQRADQTAKPLVLKLKSLRDAYAATKTAESEAELQLAVNQAVLVIADFVRAVQSARGGT